MSELVRWKCPKCGITTQQKPAVTEVSHNCPDVGRMVTWKVDEPAISRNV